MPLVYFFGLALLVFLPVLGDGYVLTLDMIFAPGADYFRFGLGEKGPLYYGRLPLLLALDAVTLTVPHWVVQKILLLAIVTAGGYSMYAACRARTTTGALFAGTLYAINPFVYVRLLAGHWWFLLGYAVLPLAVVSFANALTDRTEARRAAAWTTLAIAFDPHVAALALVPYACLGVVVILRSSRPRSVLSSAALFAGLTALLNAYWLLPALVTLGSGTSKVSRMNALDLAAFSARGQLMGNVPLSVSTLHGFWRGGYLLPFELVPLPAYLLAFTALLFLAVTGWYGRREHPFESGLAAAGVLGFVLSLGVSVDATAPVFRLLYEHVVVFRGMRDSQKFVALLVLVYAFLGARGVDRLHTVRGRPTAEWDRASPLRRLANHPTARTTAKIALAAGVVTFPLLYSWPMLGGFSGQLSSTEYPDGWAAANDHLIDDPGDYRVLFLPWHQYMTFPWTGRRVANPADLYFDRPVVRSRSMDIAGIESQAPSPAHRRVETILEDPRGAESTGSELAPLGVKYVIVAKAVDYRRYDYLRRQPDLVVVEENDGLVMYENRAFEEAPPADRWPRAWPVVPWRALFAGSIVSVAALLVAFVRPPFRGWWDGAIDASG